MSRKVNGFAHLHVTSACCQQQLVRRAPIDGIPSKFPQCSMKSQLFNTYIKCNIRLDRSFYFDPKPEYLIWTYGYPILGMDMACVAWDCASCVYFDVLKGKSGQPEAFILEHSTSHAPVTSSCRHRRNHLQTQHKSNNNTNRCDARLTHKQSLGYETQH